VARLDSRSSSGYELEDQSDQSQHKQNVNKTTHGVAANNTQQPQNKQHYEDCPKHMSSPLKFRSRHKVGRVSGWVRLSKIVSCWLKMKP